MNNSVILIVVSTIRFFSTWTWIIASGFRLLSKHFGFRWILSFFTACLVNYFHEVIIWWAPKGKHLKLRSPDCWKIHLRHSDCRSIACTSGIFSSEFICSSRDFSWIFSFVGFFYEIECFNSIQDWVYNIIWHFHGYSLLINIVHNNVEFVMLHTELCDITFMVPYPDWSHVKLSLWLMIRPLWL